MRSEVSEERPSGLTLMALFRDKFPQADKEEILNRFAARPLATTPFLLNLFNDGNHVQ